MTRQRLLSHLRGRFRPPKRHNPAVAASQRPKSTSTNKRKSGGDRIGAAVERYLRDLERAPLAVRTREAYGQHVGAYGAWLADGRSGVAITDPRGRDHATRDFKRHLKLERGWKPSSVNLALAAVDHFNRFLGLGPANVKREPLAQAAPKALSEEQQRGRRAPPRSHGRGSGDRDLAAVHGTQAPRARRPRRRRRVDLARKGLLVVRSGKGDAYREVPLNRSCRQALEDWLKPRATLTTDLAPLFVGLQARRLTPRSVDRVVRGVAARAGLELSAHLLRHTCVTNLVRGGSDLVLVAEWLVIVAWRRRGAIACRRRRICKRRWTASRSSRDCERARSAVPDRGRRR